jgi:hypothetical protein
MKTPPASEDVDGVFHAFTSFEVAALERSTSSRPFRSGERIIFRQFTGADFFDLGGGTRFPCNPGKPSALLLQVF